MFAGSDKVIRERGFEDTMMLEGRARRSTADPACCAPQKIIERLIIAGKAERVAEAHTNSRGQSRKRDVLYPVAPQPRHQGAEDAHRAGREHEQQAGVEVGGNRGR